MKLAHDFSNSKFLGKLKPPTIAAAYFIAGASGLNTKSNFLTRNINAFLLGAESSSQTFFWLAWQPLFGIVVYATNVDGDRLTTKKKRNLSAD